MIKGAVFDADGVLLNSMMIWDKAAFLYLGKLDRVPEKGFAEKVFSMSMEECADYLITGYDLKQSREETIRGILDVISDFYRYEVKLKPHVVEFLEEFRSRNIPIVIATSGNRELLIAALARLGVIDFFEKVFSCSDYHTTKHETTIFEAAAEYLGERPQDMVVMEDTLYSLKTAKRAGFNAVGVYDSFSAKDSEEIIAVSDFYMKDFAGRADFWSYVSSI